MKGFDRVSRDPIGSQYRLLRDILGTNADTAYGRRHRFGALSTFREFQEQVPIASYEDLEPYMKAAMAGQLNQLTKHSPVLFTTTSGTTGARKYVPMTRESRQSKARVTWLWLAALYRDHPNIVAGRILSVVSPEVESYAPSGVPCGAESGHAYRTMPKPIQSMYTAPYAVFSVKDYEARYYTLLRLAAGQDISAIATVTPATIVLLAERLAAHTEAIIRDVRDGTLSSDFAVPAELRASLRLQPDPERARRLERAVAAGDGVLRPGLAAIGCWKGGTVGSYLANFGIYLPQRPPVRDLGYYATELRGSVPLSDEGDAGVVAVGTNVLEFSPADDGQPQGRDLVPIERLEIGQRYFVYVTNASGLYRHEMNDIVEVAGMYQQTPLIRFIQKGKGVVSIAGEKLSEVQVIAAVDEALRDHNLEYQRKRVSLRYGAPIIRVVRAGEFDRYRRRMVETGQRADGQFKILRLTSDTSFAAEFAAERDLVGSGERTSA